MRITGGLARGIPLVLPKGGAVRPATDAMRQAVFSCLAARVPGSRFLDLFAGSGAYGLEALSRGATGGVFVERHARTVACLRRNLDAVCKSLGRTSAGIDILATDACGVPLGPGPAPDLVFIDPPWEIITTVAPALFTRLTDIAAVNSDLLVVFEMPGEITVTPPRWTCRKRLGQGARQPTVCLFSAAGSAGPAAPTST